MLQYGKYQEAILDADRVINNKGIGFDGYGHVLKARALFGMG